MTGDLFADLPGQAAPDRPVRSKGLYAALPGSGPAGETCGSCANLCRKRMGNTYLKCGLARAWWTGGPGTDVKARSAACSKWEAK